MRVDEKALVAAHKILFFQGLLYLIELAVGFIGLLRRVDQQNPAVAFKIPNVTQRESDGFTVKLKAEALLLLMQELLENLAEH